MAWLRTSRRIELALWLAVLAGPVWAGGPHSQSEELQQAGFFGFVRDTSGTAVPDARVTANFTKRQIKLIARSNLTGLYIISKLGTNTDLKTVIITCSKDGYSFVKAMPRALVPPPGKPVEVECILKKK